MNDIDPPERVSPLLWIALAVAAVWCVHEWVLTWQAGRFPWQDGSSWF